TQTRYFMDLRVHYLTGCVVVADRALDRMLPARREQVRAAFADGESRFDEAELRTDDTLIGGLFQRQGLKQVPVDSALHAELEAAAVRARQQLRDSPISATLLDRVVGLLSAFRTQRAKR